MTSNNAVITTTFDFASTNLFQEDTSIFE